MSADAALTTVAQSDLVAQQGRLIIALSAPPIWLDAFAFTISGPRPHSAGHVISCTESLIDEVRNCVEPHFRFRA